MRSREVFAWVLVGVAALFLLGSMTGSGTGPWGMYGMYGMAGMGWFFILMLTLVVLLALVLAREWRGDRRDDPPRQG